VSTTSVLASTGLCPPGPPAPGWLAVEDGVIVEVSRDAPPGGADDWGDAILAPAYLDLQVNGVDDVDFATADGAAWDRAARTLARHGVSSYLATLVSAPLDAYDAALQRLAAVIVEAEAGAAVALGAHLEGPFLGDAPGAHPPELLRSVDLAWLEGLLDAHPDAIRMVTLAPEADPGGRAIARLADRGVLVALGHSRVLDSEARAAASAGARVVTHVFNGMGPLHHREPGLAGAALDDERLTPSLIADLVHVHPTVVRLVFAASRAVAIVSDAVAVGGDVHAVDGAARLPDGRLAGATVLLDEAVANVVRIGVPIERVVAAASTVPAALLGLVDRGRLLAGARADVVALEPGTARLLAVWVGGERVA
jgi:N-acetylglucosamine-6-phosphate deacetylase